MISIDDFKKINIVTGKILSAEKVADTDKLLKFSVDVGEPKPRQIISGIAKFRTPEEMLGLTCVFITNLEPREIRGLESQGMILALGGNDEVPFALLRPDKDVSSGVAVK